MRQFFAADHFAPLYFAAVDASIAANITDIDGVFQLDQTFAQLGFFTEDQVVFIFEII